MYLSLVEIRNFRSFEFIDIKFQKGLNVLVGRNNTGKTNILQAIRFALGSNASSGDSVWLDRDDFYKSSVADETERTISITLTFSELNAAQRSYFYEIVDFDLTNLEQSRAIIRFEATWPKGKRHPSTKRTGGPSVAEAPEVPTKILGSLPLTFLPALRDAEACLAPGHRSRLAQLLRETARKQGKLTEDTIVEIFKNANREFEEHPLVQSTRGSLQTTTKELAGTDYLTSAIKANEVEFEKILRSLKVQMDGAPVAALDSNGLGYNNLLYIAVVLEYLKAPDPEEFPLFLVEEPEAHLHPQLTLLLAEYLAFKTPGTTVPQTLVTTHSPTLAASIPISRVNVLFSEHATLKANCNCLGDAGMDQREQDSLQRMMDVTRAALYFAKGIIFVEGISEALLFPVLARRLGHDLAKLHISVIPICGVAFETFKKLLGNAALAVPASIVTDADPPILEGATWKEDIPEKDGAEFKLSDRTQKLKSQFNGHPTAEVFNSQITLEYDLAEAGIDNSLLMASVWEDCFAGKPSTFNIEKVNEAGLDVGKRAMSAWRGICRADHAGSKAEFSQRLAAKLLEKQVDQPNLWKNSFEVPPYIKNAIIYVVQACTPILANKTDAQSGT